MPEMEMRKIELNLMALLMAKGARDKKLPAEELKVLKTFVEKYPKEHQIIMTGKCPY